MAVKNKVSAATADKGSLINDVIYKRPLKYYIFNSLVGVMPLEMVPNVRHSSLHCYASKAVHLYK